MNAAERSGGKLKNGPSIDCLTLGHISPEKVLPLCEVEKVKVTVAIAVECMKAFIRSNREALHHRAVVGQAALAVAIAVSPKRRRAGIADFIAALARTTGIGAANASEAYVACLVSIAEDPILAS
jgi:hypothetical protein